MKHAPRPDVPRRKIMVIGLDCADPELVFDRWLHELPNIRQVVTAGISGRLHSSLPPITVPAWMSMMTGRDPGALGLYGFRNRADHSYSNMRIASSASIREPTLWDMLGQHGKYSIVIGVPPTYPVRPVNGELVSCFLTPSAAECYTHPPELAGEIRDLVGDYRFDSHGFRTEKKDRLLSEIYDMTEKRFKVARHLLATRPWDFFVMVEIGLDRIHHGFWHFMDEEHVLHPGPTPYQDAIHQYYLRLDRLVGGLLEMADENTCVLIVSDHGAKRMDGSIAVNEWLIERGYLVLKSYPPEVTRFADLEVDWQATRAWGEGGYYSRVFVNLEDREPSGIVKPQQYEALRQELKAGLEAIPDAAGNPLPTRAEMPEELYPEVRNIAPDLFVFFGDLYWRATGTVGHGKIHLRENDTGPDGANHDWHGIFAMAEGRALAAGGGTGRTETRSDLWLFDVAPTVLAAFDLPVPARLQGRVIPGRST